MKSRQTLSGHEDSVYDVRFAPKDNRLASAGRDGQVIVWRPDGSIDRRFDLDEFAVAVCFSPDGRLLAAGNAQGRLALWRTEDGGLVWETNLPGLETIAFAPDGSRLVAGGEQGGFHAFAASSGQQSGSISLGNAHVTSIAFSPDGTYAAVATADAGIFFLDTETWKQVHTSGDDGRTVVYTCVFSRDGICAATLHVRNSGPIGTTDDPDLYEIAIWQPLEEEPNLNQTLLGHVSWMKGLEFSPGGDLLASGGADESVCLWDPDFHALVAEGREHEGTVFAVSFSPDGATLASCAADRTIKLWEAAPDRVESEALPRGWFLEDVVDILGGSDARGRPLVLNTARLIADRLLLLDSVKEIEDAVAEVIDVAFSSGAVDLGRAVTQTLTVRGEQARRTQDEVTAFRCARVNTLFNQAIDHQTGAALASLDEPRASSTAPRQVEPTDALPDLNDLLAEVVAGQLPAEGAAERARTLRPTAGDLLAAARELHAYWPEIIRGQRDGRPVSAAVGIVAELGESTDDDELHAFVDDYMGRLLCLQGDNEAGLRWFERGLSAVAALDNPALHCSLVGNLANAYRNLGRLREARRAYEDAIASASDNGLYEQHINHLSNLAMVEADVGNTPARIELLREARTVASTHHFDEQLASVANNLGGAYYRVGDYVGAKDLYEEALAGAQRSQNTRLHALAVGNLAQVLAKLGEMRQARDRYKEALTATKAIGDASAESHALAGLSRLAARDDDAGLAEELALRAVEVAQRGHAATRLLSALKALAALREEAGSQAEAIAVLEQAAAVGESIRGEILRAEEGAGIQTSLADVYGDLVRLYADTNQPREALARAERGRAALLVRRLEADGGADLEAELAQIGPRAVLVSYYLAEEELFVFVMRADGEGEVHLERRNASADFLASVQEDFAREVRDAGYEQIGESWVRLAEVAIEPALPYLRDTDLLVLVPHGPLHNLPMHALSAGEGRVIDRWPVVYLPAASALSFLSARESGPPAAPLVVGAHFADEARAVADLLPGERPIIGEDVDKEDVLAAMTDADLIHISAHGFFSEREPDLSGWIVRPSAELENYLSVREKYGWQRNFSQTQQMHLLEDWAFSGVITASDLDAIRLRASLVAASACESGVVATDPSDDPAGLMPALLASGARGVLATLWLADAETTKTVMLTFYSALSRTSTSWSKTAEALQAAVLEAKKQNDNPHFWAPYVMIGGLTAGAAD
jgi:tetratricopeptide (TPR) repeat protein